MEACCKFVKRAIILLLLTASLPACVATREITLTPRITGTHEAFEIDEHAGCPLWYAPSARGPITEQGVSYDDNLLLAGYHNELNPDPGVMPCYPYYLAYQTMLLFDLESTGGTFVQSAFLEIDKRQVLFRGGTRGSRCRMLIGRADETWPFGLSSERGRDTVIGTSSDFLLLDAFRSGTQRIDLTRIVRPQLTGVNRGIVISPVSSLTFRREFEDGDETDCVVQLGNPRLTVKVLVPDPDR